MNKSIDGFLSEDSFGSIERALGNAMYGFNHANVKPVIEKDVDNIEKVFFVRPQFNMSASNLRNDREMTNLITTTSNSLQSYIRHTLDPRLLYSNSKNENKKTPDFMDNQNPFIPLLSNTLRTMSGFPDRTLPTFTSKSGVRGEQYTAPDGVFDFHGVVEIDCVFDKLKGDPVERLISVWTRVMGLQVEGIMVPYMKEDIMRTRNYDTRIYRINLDGTGTFVTSIAATGIAFPIVDNIGKQFDYERDKQRDRGNTTNFRFRAIDVMYNDPILIKEFNDTSAQFNRDIRNMLNGKDHSLFKLPREIKNKYNNIGYPIIDDSTMELEWWISKDSGTYKKIKASLSPNELEWYDDE
jgi:hypothetical protein